MESNIMKDQSGHPTIKIVFHGPSGVGKTSMLKVLTALKRIEDPPRLASELSRIESPSGSTVFFDKVTIHAGEVDLMGNEKGVRMHLWATAGDIRHRKQRDIVFEGTQGIVLLLSANPNDMERNKECIDEVSERFPNGIPHRVVINKTDLYEPDLNEITRLLNSSNLMKVKTSYSRVYYMVSVLNARNDLVSLLQSNQLTGCLSEEGRLLKQCRPQSVNNLVDPLRSIAFEIVSNLLSR